jgi:hypothetical protein
LVVSWRCAGGPRRGWGLLGVESRGSVPAVWGLCQTGPPTTQTKPAPKHASRRTEARSFEVLGGELAMGSARGSTAPAPGTPRTSRNRGHRPLIHASTCSLAPGPSPPRLSTLHSPPGHAPFPTPSAQTLPSPTFPPHPLVRPVAPPCRLNA